MSCCLVLTSEVVSVESSVSIESSDYSMSNASDKPMSDSSDKSVSNTPDKSMSDTSHNSMSNDAGGEDTADPVGVGAVQAARVVGDGSHRGAKGLGLGHTPVLSLQRLHH